MTNVYVDIEEKTIRSHYDGDRDRLFWHESLYLYLCEIEHTSSQIQILLHADMGKRKHKIRAIT